MLFPGSVAHSTQRESQRQSARPVPESKHILKGRSPDHEQFSSSFPLDQWWPIVVLTARVELPACPTRKTLHLMFITSCFSEMAHFTDCDLVWVLLRGS